MCSCTAHVYAYLLLHSSEEGTAEGTPNILDTQHAAAETAHGVPAARPAARTWNWPVRLFRLRNGKHDALAG